MDEDLLEVPTRTYKVTNGRVAGFVDEQDAMRQAIEKVLSTERFAFDIFSDSYGVEYSDLIGEQIDLVKAEVERIITEAIVVDDRILSIENFKITEETKDSLTIKFEVSTIFGTLFIREGVTI